MTSFSSFKTLGVLLFPEFETLDVFGPLEMFGMLSDRLAIAMISEHGGLVQSAQGQLVHTEFHWHNAPPLDLLLVPGGMGTRKEVFNSPLLHWIKTRSEQSELTLSVCTGSTLLAKAGLLDGLKATSNKRAFNWVMEQGPQVHWVKKARWVDAGRIISSAGIAAGIDMSLYTIARLYGEALRDEVAQRAEYSVNINADLDPFVMED
ncbi:DJ-1/PfpI family protein [Legionella sp. km772]|uniref:DJ-1/PfpI family protein n=1 Tax=Legionella sp. km772 TaxID=2498111 RepID=UPI000F8CCF22|nr:DJ-1/PfpI family protein [Legionella sp. km772]RUR09731.1 DJ-1/PfpI family protein [Legionella sp. km772]